MSKLYDVVGVSAVRVGAPPKLRFANGKPARRARILERNGHDNIILIALDKPMTKDDAVRVFMGQYPEYEREVLYVYDKTQPKVTVKSKSMKVSTPKAPTGTAQLSAAALKAVAAVTKKVA